MRIFLFLFLAATTCAADKLFEVVPAERVPFNYPSAPREGEPAFFPIAKDGEPQCVIVQSSAATAPEQAVVRALQSYLSLVTGGHFTVIDDTQPVPVEMAAIHVGETIRGKESPLELPELRYGEDRFPNLSGYLVKTVDRRTLIIRGVSETATNHAVVGFVKRYLGIRQYWQGKPGDIGDVIPSRPTLSLPEVEWRDWPYFFSSQMSQRPFSKSRPALDFFRHHQTLRSTENYNIWLPPGRFAEAHPEYFPLINGERRKPKDSDGATGWQPCISNPDVPRIMGEAVLEYFRMNPQAPGINFAINDGGGDCTCQACRAMDAPGTDYSSRVGMSDRYMKLSNQVCEIVGREFPTKWIVYLAYAAAQSAPTVRPHPNLVPVLTTGENIFGQWDQWMKAGARHLGMYLHHNDTFYILPKLDTHQNARRIQYAVASGQARVFYMESHTQWPFADTVPYTTSELLWDPRQDVDALLNEYFESFYASAAQPMRAYYEAIESGYQRWLGEEGVPHWFGKDISSNRYPRVIEQFRVLNPQEAARASDALAQAAAKAKGDEKVSQRIEIIRAMFMLQELAVQWAWAGFRLRDAAPQSEPDVRRIVEDARLILDHSRKMRRHIVEVLEQPPLKNWMLFQNSTRPLAMYAAFKSGEPGPEMLAAIGGGINAGGDYLRKKLSGEQAAAWWRALRSNEQDPTLIAAFQGAENRALGKEPKNVLRDPGFEEVGKELAPDAVTLERDRVLDPDQVKRIGIKLWFEDRSPYRCAITEGEAHAGRYALSIERCFRARFDASAPIKPGLRYRVGLWFRQKEGQAKYRFAVDARLADGSYPVLATVPIANTSGEWREIVTEIVAPPNAASIILRLYIDKQSADAKCWIDDAFVGEIPQ